MHPGISAPSDSKGLHKGKNPFFKEHLRKIILRGFFCLFFCLVFRKIFHIILKIKFYNTKCFTPPRKMTATDNFISISLQTTNKGTILKSFHPVKWKQSLSSTASPTLYILYIKICRIMKKHNSTKEKLGFPNTSNSG